MRITLLQGAFLPVPALRGGAVEKMWYRLGAAFAARGHAVTHVSRHSDGLPARERVGDVSHVRVRGYEQPRNGVLLKLRDFFYSRRAVRAAPPADVVVTNTFWSPLLLDPEQGAVCVDVQRMPKGQMRFYRGAARLRANSQAVRDAIVREYPPAAARVKVIPNPLPFDFSHEVGWEAKERVVLFAGRLHPEKGIELLLTAWRRLRAEGRLSGWRLQLVGPADEAHGGGGEGWVARLKQRFASEKVAWTPPIYDEAALSRVYERAAVFVYPSLAEKGETFGLAVLEAMAWGAAPVVSDLACFRDFVVAGENGIVFDHCAADAAGALANALANAADDGGRVLATNAVAVRATHAVARIADEFLDDFAQISRT